MLEPTARSIAHRLSWPRVVFGALMLLCLCLNSHQTLSAAGEQEAGKDLEGLAKKAALKAATKRVTAGFAPSLEMKENADFLLTPVLLVQEAIRDDVVITYPCE